MFIGPLPFYTYYNIDYALKNGCDQSIIDELISQIPNLTGLHRTQTRIIRPEYK